MGAGDWGHGSSGPNPGGASGQAGGSSPEKPKADWQPDTGNADNGDPWHIHKTIGVDPTPPLVPGGVETPGKGVHVVSVKAIQLYATNIELLLPEITRGITLLDELSARGFGAGNFGAANNFKSVVFGAASGQNGSTLLASTRSVFVESETIIKEIAARCREIARRYQNTSDLSELDAEEFGNMVSIVKSKVDGLPLGSAS